MSEAVVTPVKEITNVESTTPKKKRKRNKNKNAAKPQAPAKKVEKPRLTREEKKEEKFAQAASKSTKTIERLKENDADGTIIPKTYGFNYNIFQMAENLSVLQEIQNSFAEGLSRAAKTGEISKITESTEALSMFAGELKKLAESLETTKVNFLELGYGPRWAKVALEKSKTEAQKEAQKQNAEEKQEDVKLTAAQIKAAAKVAETETK